MIGEVSDARSLTALFAAFPLYSEDDEADIYNTITQFGDFHNNFSTFNVRKTTVRDDIKRKLARALQGQDQRRPLPQWLRNELDTPCEKEKAIDVLYHILIRLRQYKGKSKRGPQRSR